MNDSEIRKAFDDAKQHLFWLKENNPRDTKDNARIVGFTECLELWQAALSSLPRVTEDELVGFVASAIKARRKRAGVTVGQIKDAEAVVKLLAAKFPHIVKHESVRG